MIPTVPLLRGVADPKRIANEATIRYAAARRLRTWAEMSPGQPDPTLLRAARRLERQADIMLRFGDENARVLDYAV